MKVAGVVTAIVVWAAVAVAGPKDDATKPDDAASKDAAAEIPHIVGPKLVDLGNNTEITVPAGMWLIERAEAVKIQEKMGNDTTSVVALVADPNADWMIVIDYADVGYVNDDDADQLDSGELLESYKQGTLEQNAKRRQLKIPELFVDDWSERPHYERAARRLVWGIRAHDTDGQTVNFMTRILGRNGFLSIDLIDAPERIEASKKNAVAVLDATHFRPGYRHADHRDGDRDSGVGLTGLVLGGTGIALAAKSGFLIKLLLVLKKGIIFIALAIGGLFRWLFRRRQKSAERAAVDAAAKQSAEPPPTPPAVTS